MDDMFGFPVQSWDENLMYDSFSSGFDQPAMSYSTTPLPAEFELLSDQPAASKVTFDLPPELEGGGLTFGYEPSPPEEITFQVEILEKEMPRFERSTIRRDDGSWVPHDGYPPPDHDEEDEPEPNLRSYDRPLRPRRSMLRSNPLEMRLAPHFKLPESAYCPVCHRRLDYMGRCAEESCPNYQQVVDRELYEWRQKEIEEQKMDNAEVMRRWEEEMERLGGM